MSGYFEVGCESSQENYSLFVDKDFLYSRQLMIEYNVGQGWVETSDKLDIGMHIVEFVDRMTLMGVGYKCIFEWGWNFKSENKRYWDMCMIIYIWWNQNHNYLYKKNEQGLLSVRLWFLPMISVIPKILTTISTQCSILYECRIVSISSFFKLEYMCTLKYFVLVISFSC